MIHFLLKMLFAMWLHATANNSLHCVTVRASDKRISCDEEFSDSEDEGDGGRRNRESFKHRKRLKISENGDKKAEAEDKGKCFLVEDFRSSDFLERRDTASIPSSNGPVPDLEYSQLRLNRQSQIQSVVPNYP